MEEEATIRKFRIVQQEGTGQVAKAIDLHNLCMATRTANIISKMEDVLNAFRMEVRQSI